MNKIRLTDWGFTLIEMLTVVIIVGIMAAIAVPSLISMNNPMKSSVDQVNSMLKTVNLVARANSGNPYRIRPGYDAGAVTGKYYFIVETLKNGTCDNSPTALNWLNDNNKFVYLPYGIAIRDGANTANFETLDSTNQTAMTICFDGRGTEFNGGRTFNLIDTQRNSGVYRVAMQISAVGDVSYSKFDASNNLINN